MGELLHVVQRGAAWAGWVPAQSPPRCTKCNSPLINGQCTNFILFDVALMLPLHSKGLIDAQLLLELFCRVTCLRVTAVCRIEFSGINFDKVALRAAVA